jgi:hypothetical protein
MRHEQALPVQLVCPGLRGSSSPGSRRRSSRYGELVPPSELIQTTSSMLAQRAKRQRHAGHHSGLPRWWSTMSEIGAHAPPCRGLVTRFGGWEERERGERRLPSSEPTTSWRQLEERARQLHLGRCAPEPFATGRCVHCSQGPRRRSEMHTGVDIAHRLSAAP